MTLIPYDAQRLDDIALRILDLAGAVRRMSTLCRENDLSTVNIHDKKAQEWIGRLDDWARDADARLQTAAIKARAVQRALRPATPGAPDAAAARRTRKK